MAARLKAQEPVSEPVGNGVASLLVTRKVRNGAAEALDPSKHLPFLLIWTGGYQATDRGVYPDLRCQPLINGVAGLLQRRDGRWETDGLEYNLGRCGHVPLLAEASEYCREFSGYPDCYGHPWERVEHGRVVVDEEAFDAWRSTLMERGLIPPPGAADLQYLLAQLDRQIGNKPDVNDEIRATLQRRRALVAARLEAL